MQRKGAPQYVEQSAYVQKEWPTSMKVVVDLPRHRDPESGTGKKDECWCNVPIGHVQNIERCVDMDRRIDEDIRDMHLDHPEDGQTTRYVEEDEPGIWTWFRSRHGRRSSLLFVIRRTNPRTKLKVKITPTTKSRKMMR